jgi:hypothetical protein
MADVMNSLFGMTPESIQRQRDNELQARALQFAKLDPQQAAQMAFYTAGSRLGDAGAGLLGYKDPELQRQEQRQGLMQGLDLTSAESLQRGIQTAMQNGDYKLANELAGKLQTASKSALDADVQRSIIAKNLREKEAVDPFQKLVESGKYTPESLAKYRQTQNPADLMIYEKPAIESKSEFERILGSLNLSPEQEAQVKKQWVQAKLNPDGSGLKSLQAQLLQTQIEQKQLKLEADREKTATEKSQAVSKLSSTESNLDTALTTAERALKLAPGSMVGGLNQAVSSVIPWTDAKALNNLVSSLNSEKAIGTLEELKSQSRTGATGFGALSEKELALLLNKTRALDPTDKMFKENLGVVMDGWSKIRKQVRESRLNLQGKKDDEGTTPMYATNPTTKQRIMSTDGGKTWTQAR